jgi:hypothetical protein
MQARVDGTQFAYPSLRPACLRSAYAADNPIPINIRTASEVVNVTVMWLFAVTAGLFTVFEVPRMPLARHTSGNGQTSKKFSRMLLN